MVDPKEESDIPARWLHPAQSLGIPAVDKLASTARDSEILTMDGLANEINWSITPLVAINKAFRCAIVGRRSFDSDSEKICQHMLAQLSTFQNYRVAETAMH
jgi:beta-N-acetylhexosaminidase